MQEKEDQRPELAEAFYIENKTTGTQEEIACECGKKAIAYYKESFYCSKCWEYFPTTGAK